MTHISRELHYHSRKLVIELGVHWEIGQSQSFKEILKTP